jgi:hypothetical protein
MASPLISNPGAKTFYRGFVCVSVPSEDGMLSSMAMDVVPSILGFFQGKLAQSFFSSGFSW